MSITQEQIERLRLSVDEAHHDEFPAGYEPVGLQALLDAYEERGREVERLRAKVGDHDSARQAEKERADHAESEVKRLRESYTASDQAPEFIVRETPLDDPVDFVARMLESKEKELSPSKVRQARRRLKAIAAQHPPVKAEVERLRADLLSAADRELDAASRVEQAEARLARVVVLLREIARGAGPFSLDPLEHASNTIEAMKSLAETALAAAQPEEKP